jgi:hypothetical protein
MRRFLSSTSFSSVDSRPIADDVALGAEGHEWCECGVESVSMSGRVGCCKICRVTTPIVLRHTGNHYTSISTTHSPIQSNHRGNVSQKKEGAKSGHTALLSPSLLQ